jgi:hypothetical protein
MHSDDELLVQRAACVCCVTLGYKDAARVGQEDLGLCVVCMAVHRVCWWACGGQPAETACGWADLWDGETEYHGGE